MKLSKINVAEAQLCAAICLFFQDAHPVPVYTLAAAAREILTTVGQKLQIETFLDEIARWKGVPFKEEIKKAAYYINFFKHADRDPTAVLSGFSDQVNDPLIFCVCRDLGRIAEGLPVHAQVFEAWFFATMVKQVSVEGVWWQEKVKRCIRLFPGVRSAPRPEQKRIALEVLASALQNPALQMT